jgi:catechol 2,3-dioxygenase-like lactoylglutathione lyase family enzyme
MFQIASSILVRDLAAETIMKIPTSTAITGVCCFILGAAFSSAPVRGQSSNKMQGTLAHIAFAVKDVDKTSATFGEILGVKTSPGRVVKGVKFPPSYGGQTMNVKFTQFTANGVGFELLEPLDGPSPWKDFIDKHGEGVHHIGFNVADATEARVFLESQGGKWTQAASPTSAYIDMEPKLPITFEVFGPNPAAAPPK